MKELMEKLEKLQKIADEKNKKKFKEDKELVRAKINDLVNESEEALFCVSDKGLVALGSTIEMITAIGVALKSMSKDKNVPREVIFSILKDVFDEEENKTEDDELEDLYNEFKKMFGEF